MNERQVVVGEFRNELDAELAKGLLESAGIQGSIIKDDGGNMFPSLQETEGVQLLVSEEREQEARNILGEKDQTAE